MLLFLAKKLQIIIRADTYIDILYSCTYLGSHRVYRSILSTQFGMVYNMKENYCIY